VSFYFFLLFSSIRSFLVTNKLTNVLIKSMEESFLQKVRAMDLRVVQNRKKASIHGVQTFPTLDASRMYRNLPFVTDELSPPPPLSILFL
jgi:hypothetical protein